MNPEALFWLVIAAIALLMSILSATAAALILAAPIGVAANPAEIGLLGLVGHMLEAQHVPGSLDGLG